MPEPVFTLELASGTLRYIYPTASGLRVELAGGTVVYLEVTVA